MARLARVIAVGHPHHVIQRGNRCQKVFFNETDKKKYLEILDLQAKLFELEVWAYCLMDNHVHLIVTPKKEDSLTRTISETHQLYTRMINFRENWRGYLWQGRFKSNPMDERYLYGAVRYVERNPVRAKMVKKPEQYQWSSAKAHVGKEKEGLLSDFDLPDEIDNWSDYLRQEDDEKELKLFRQSIKSGRPLGSKKYLRNLETKLGRMLIKQKPGPGCN